MNQTEKNKILKVLTSELQALNLPGLKNPASLEVFAMQVLDSIRRVNWVYTHRNRDISKSVCDPSNAHFDPIKAAIFFHKEGNIDEASWFIFLSTVCGRHSKMGWSMLKQIYDSGIPHKEWSWARVTNPKNDFDSWYRANQPSIKRAFGNHRKFESLNPDSHIGTNKVIQSYIEWIGPSLCHDTFFKKISTHSESPEAKFECFYRSMQEVLSFGRMSIFDYLCMMGKVGLLDVEPGSIYIAQATGPKRGTIKLFGLTNNKKNTSKALEEKVQILYDNLSIGQMGYQVLEDAICNWQKSPRKYILFSG